MSQKRFTKLHLHTDNNNTEIIISSVLQSIIDSSSNQYQQNMLKAYSKKMLTQQVMYKKINTVGQAYHTNPIDHPFHQENNYNNTVREGNRPFSAKIYRKQTKCQISSKKSINGTQRQSTRSGYKNSICHSTKSRQGKRNAIFKPNLKFQPIDQDKTAEDSFQQAFIDSLREKKIKEQAYQKSKEQFLKDSIQQNEKYPKMNRKFLQTMGNKNYYYNKNGQTIENLPSNSRLMKKTNINRISTKVEQTKRVNTDSTKTEMTVQYQQKENYLKRTRQAFTIQEKPNVLFYKSEQCKYQIIA